MHHRGLDRAVWLLLAFVCGGASVAWAQTAFPLSSLIDPEVALYVEVAHPDQQWAAWEQSELARRWQQTGLEAMLAQTDFVRQWRKIDEAVAQITPHTLTDHLRGLCGEGLSLAVFVPEQGPPQGLWVSRARSAAVLESTLKAWDTLETPAKTERRGTSRAEFFARRVRKGAHEQTLFYARRDDVLVLSDQESLVAACALRLNEVGGAAAPAGKGFLTEAELVVPDASTAAVWVYGNPRAWDRWLDREFDHSPGAQLARNVWRSLRGLGASLRLDHGPTLTITATIDPRHEHPGWTSATTSESTEVPARPEQLSVLRGAPNEAVFVAGGSVRPGWWLQKLQMLQSDREKEDWRRIQRVLRGAFGGLDPFGQVAPALFHDWGLVVLPREGVTPSLRPADWSVASVHQLSGVAEADPQLVGAVDDALGLGMQLLAANLNGTTDDAAVTPVRTRGDGTLGRVMSGRRDWDFGYEFAANRLVLGWPLAAMRQRFNEPVGETELSELSAREFTQPSLMAWVNLEAVRTAAGRDSERIRLRDRSPLPLRFAGLVDRGFAAMTLAPERVEFKLGGRFAPAH